MDKRGLSAIVATLLIVLITIAAVLLVWNVVKKNLESSSEEVSSLSDILTSSTQLKIKNAEYDGLGNVYVRIENDGNDLSKLDLVISNDSSSKNYSIDVPSGIKIININNISIVSPKSISLVYKNKVIDSKEIKIDYGNSLVLMMHFDNNSAIGENNTYAVDVSKYGNNGIIYGAIWSSDCISGSCLSFDGIDDYVNIGNDSSLNPTQEITIEAWIEPEGPPASGSQEVIVSKHAGYYPKSQSYLLAWNGVNSSKENKTISFYVSGDGQNLTERRSTTLIEPNSGFHHVVGVFKGGEKLDVYIDGKLENGNLCFCKSSTDINCTDIGIPSSIAITNIPVRIGRWRLDSGNMFNGTIDEVRIYNRALSEDEIKHLYVSNL